MDGREGRAQGAVGGGRRARLTSRGRGQGSLRYVYSSVTAVSSEASRSWMTGKVGRRMSPRLSVSEIFIWLARL